MTLAEAMTTLLDRWAGNEERFRAYGQESTAAVLARCRQDLETWWREFQFAELTLEEAATYSGWSYDTIRRKLSEGEIPNAGEKGRPRVRRGDLPMKPPGSPDLNHPGALVAHILTAREART